MSLDLAPLELKKFDLESLDRDVKKARSFVVSLVPVCSIRSCSATSGSGIHEPEEMGRERWAEWCYPHCFFAAVAWFRNDSRLACCSQSTRFLAVLLTTGFSRFFGEKLGLKGSSADKKPRRSELRPVLRGDFSEAFRHGLERGWARFPEFLQWGTFLLAQAGNPDTTVDMIQRESECRS